MKAIQAWRWMPGSSHIQQSYIIRVPDGGLVSLARTLVRVSLEQEKGLPPPSIVDVEPEPVDENAGRAERWAAYMRDHEPPTCVKEEND